VGVVSVNDGERLPVLVRYAFWIYLVILVFAIVAGVLVGDNDLTFELAGVGGAVWLIWGFYVLTNRSQARGRLAELHGSQTMRMHPGPSVLGGLSAVVIGAVFVGLAVWAIVDEVP
jgi:hypothetical protein